MAILTGLAYRCPHSPPSARPTSCTSAHICYSCCRVTLLAPSPHASITWLTLFFLFIGVRESHVLIDCIPTAYLLQTRTQCQLECCHATRKVGRPLPSPPTLCHLPPRTGKLPHYHCTSMRTLMLAPLNLSFCYRPPLNLCFCYRPCIGI